MKKLAICVVFLFAFFGNFLVEYRLIPPHVTLVTEVLIYLLFLYSLFSVQSKPERYFFSLCLPFIYFLIVTFCSIIINNYLNFQPVISLRLVLRFYIFYLALINLGIDESTLKSINKLLFILFIIQLPVVAYRFSYLGISENTIGTYATHGGGLTPIIPVVALGYLAGYYFFYRRRFFYLLLGIGFVLLGIVGEKRSLLFIYPVLFIGIYFLVFIIGKKENLLKHLGAIACISVLSITISIVIVKHHRGYNYAENPDYLQALEYAKEYTTKKGRVAATKLAFETAVKSGNLLFGFGPGSLTGSVIRRNGFDSRILSIREKYGHTGLVLILVEYGMLGVIAISSVFIILAFRCWKWFKFEKEPYWKAFSMGSLIFAAYTIFAFFCLGRTLITGDVLVPVYYYVMAAMYLRMKKITQVNETQAQHSYHRS